MGGIIITGAHLIVYINGRPFGRVNHFMYAASTPSKEIGGIDTVELLELAPTVSRVRGVMNLWRTKGDGGAEGAGMAATSIETLRSKYFSIMVVERTSDTIVFRADHARIEDQSWDGVVKDFMKGIIAWKALTWSNEVRPLKA